MKCPPPMTAVVAILGLAAAMPPRVADAALTATIQLSAQSPTVVVGQPIAIDVYLRLVRDTTTTTPARIADAQLDFGGQTTSTSTPLRFLATAAAPKAFVAGAAFAAALPTANDASLVDGYKPAAGDLDYSLAFDASGGVAANGADVLVGTLYATATTPGLYTLSANHAKTILTADDFSSRFATSYLDATFAATAAAAVPEPATLAAAAAAAAGAIVASSRRRRR